MQTSGPNSVDSRNGKQSASPAPAGNENGAAGYSVRIVVQRIVQPGKIAFRVIAYGGRQVLGHSELNSLEHLLEVLRSAVPGFDAKQLTATNIPDDISSVIYADTVTLDDSQLAILGVG